jgi:D-alanyl-D-alanine carboxypeptidase
MNDILLAIFLIFLKLFNITNIDYCSQDNFSLKILCKLKTETESVVYDLLFLEANDVDSRGLCIKTLRPEKVKQENLDIKAESALAIDLNSGLKLYDKNTDAVLPIASITKLASALVFLDHNPGWDKIYKIKEEDKREGGRINFFNGDQMTVENLFYSALVGSDNMAIIGLVNLSGLSEKEFVLAMNEKAKVLKLKRTTFYDPTGLDKRNTATVKDVYRLIKEAMKKDEIQKALSLSSYTFLTLENKTKTIKTTNELLSNDPLFFVRGKTGYLDEAGYCFVAFTEKNNKKIISVILGAETKEGRFLETEKLLNWIFNNYRWDKIKNN